MRTANANRSSVLAKWICRALGAALIIGVFAVAPNWHANSFANFSFAGAARAKDDLIGLFRSASTAEPQPALSDEGPMPDLNGAIDWLNCAGRFLDIHLHQLAASPAVRESLGGKIQRCGSGCDRRPYP